MAFALRAKKSSSASAKRLMSLNSTSEEVLFNVLCFGDWLPGDRDVERSRIRISEAASIANDTSTK